MNYMLYGKLVSEAEAIDWLMRNPFPRIPMMFDRQPWDCDFLVPAKQPWKCLYCGGKVAHTREKCPSCGAPEK